MRVAKQVYLLFFGIGGLMKLSSYKLKTWLRNVSAWQGGEDEQMGI